MSKKTNLSDIQNLNLPYIAGVKIGIVVSEWNKTITTKLYEGAKNTLEKFGYKKIITEYVPGSFELPLAASLLLEHTDVDAVICLGSIIRGETKHFDFICSTTAHGIKDVAIKFNKPVTFGVLTDENMQQSIDRSGGKYGNKGVEAAVTTIKMIHLLRKVKKLD